MDPVRIWTSMIIIFRRTKKWFLTSPTKIVQTRTTDLGPKLPVKEHLTVKKE